jgi:hypothetical protein
MMKNWKAGIHVTPKKEIKKTSRGGIKSRGYFRAQIIQFTALFASGFDRTQIIDLMELGPSEYEKLFSTMLGSYEKEVDSTSPKKAYVHYVIRHTAHIRELQQVKGVLSGEDGLGLQEPKKAQAFLGAVKAQSDFADKIIRTGLELGVLKKSRKGSITIDGLDPRDAEDQELSEILKNQFAEAKRIQAKSKKSKGKKADILVLRKTGTD